MGYWESWACLGSTPWGWCLGLGSCPARSLPQGHRYLPEEALLCSQCSDPCRQMIRLPEPLCAQAGKSEARQQLPGSGAKGESSVNLRPAAEMGEPGPQGCRHGESRGGHSAVPTPCLCPSCSPRWGLATGGWRRHGREGAVSPSVSGSETAQLPGTGAVAAAAPQHWSLRPGTVPITQQSLLTRTSPGFGLVPGYGLR